MKFLTIIRHAKSSWENPDLDDIVRPLNERGKKSILVIGDYLKTRKIKPDLMIASPSTRTMQTAIGIAKILDYDDENIKINQDIYFGEQDDVVSIVKNIKDKYKDVFLFGHEPLLSSLIYHFTNEALDKFPTCAVYRIAFNTNDWKEVVHQKGDCEFYVNAKLLIEK